MKRSFKVAALAAALVMLVAACGDDDGGSTGGDGNTLTVQADSFQFTPSSMSIPGNTDVTITLENVNNVDTHEFVILNLGEEMMSEADFAEELVYTEIEDVAPGSSASTTVNLPPGTYQVICALEGHFDSGMHGTLTVTP